MTLNHLNLAVTDVLQTQAFLEKYFNLHPLTKSYASLVVLQDDQGAVITLSNFDRATHVAYPEHFHIGFIQGSERHVNELHQRLKDDGIEVAAPRRFHGSWTFYVRAPGGILIEVLA